MKRETHKSLIENQKGGINNIQQCSVEKQKGAIAVQTLISM